MIGHKRTQTLMSFEKDIFHSQENEENRLLRTQIAEGDREFLKLEQKLVIAREALERIQFLLGKPTMNKNEREAYLIARKVLAEMEG